MIPRTMQAVVTTGHGGLDKLELRELETPVPGPGEVLVRVAACGLNNTDVWVREGAYGTDDDPGAAAGWNRQPVRFPLIQGADIVGTIAAAGDGVARERIGERVIVDLALYTDDGSGLGFWGYIGADRPGGYAEYTAVPAANAHPAGDIDLTDAELTTFPCAYLTAEHMLAVTGTGERDTVLVTGASGGVGSALVQLARARGARVVAVTGRAMAEHVRSLAPHALLFREEPHWRAQIVRQSGQNDVAVSVVADIVGGERFDELLSLLDINGRYVTAGAIGGPRVSMDLRTVYIKHLTLYGRNMGTRDDFQRLLGCIRAGKVRPLLAGTFPLSRIREAQTRFMSRDFFGKLVVIPGR